METQQVEAIKIAEMGFARGAVGRRYPLVDAEAEAAFAEGLAANTKELTKINTADCGDDRGTRRLANGTTDPDIIRQRIVSQLFGGEGLAATKAVAAANAAIIRDAKSMWEAYLIVTKILEEMGEEDGGHEDCGASNSVEISVANPIPEELLIPSVGLFIPSNEFTINLTRRNAINKRNKLEAGFYGGWDPAKHADYLSSRFPQNFSYLTVDENDHETHGHNGSGIYIVTGDNQGFAKNQFIDSTGQAAFSVTLKKMQDLAYKLGGSDEERMAILVGFADDTLHVGGGIVTEGMPVFAQTA